MITLFIAFSFTAFLQDGFSLQEVLAANGKEEETTTSKFFNLENSTTTDMSLFDYLVLHDDRRNRTVKSLETDLSATNNVDNKNFDSSQELTTVDSSLESDTLNPLFSSPSREVPLTVRLTHSQQRSLNNENLLSVENQNRTEAFFHDDNLHNSPNWKQHALKDNVLDESTSKLHVLSSDASKNFTTVSFGMQKHSETRASTPVHAQNFKTSNAKLITDRILYDGNETKGSSEIHISSSFVTSKLDVGHGSHLDTLIKANGTESSIPFVSFIPFLAKDAITANSTIGYSANNESLINDYENIEYKNVNDSAADEMESKELSMIANSFKPNLPNFVTGIEESRESINDRVSKNNDSTWREENNNDFKKLEMKDSCLIGGKLYNNGEFVKQKDDCTICRCYQRNMVCHKIECPSTPSGCSEKKQDGFCCSSITCEKVKLESDENLYAIHEMRPLRTTTLPLAAMLHSQSKNSNRALEALKLISSPNMIELTNQSVEVNSKTREALTVTTNETQSDNPANFFEISSKPLGTSLSNSLIASLKLSGCNIYGKTYRVGRIIGELTGPCNECKCTEIGITCLMIKC